MEWKPSGEDCPHCETQTEQLIESVREGGRHVEYVRAERCKPCGWRVNFNEGGE